MTLPQADLDFLAARNLGAKVYNEANMTSLVFPGWPLPHGYDRTSADLLIRLPAGYPDIQPDMWWFDPAVRLAGGGTVQSTDSVESHLGRQWQRWSRHFSAGQWKSGTDCLESFLALINNELVRSAQGAA